ncbi:cytochrome P450 [Actinoplanes tereljensis]|uniref:Cytochrome P450 n=1 Tax=Paractinoplanes tereljensis TaxID=571912 RepID=A0A919NXR7_9ACTN|nr:cytochrome P450 [Actinoplanes tereljensis]GIF26708.1 cytochrome P450 [Actinoplanes tereljensis]
MTQNGTSDPALPYPFGCADRLEVDNAYGALRQQETMARVRLPFGEDAWLATRYPDVKAVLGDPRFSRAATVGRDEPRVTQQQLGTGILSMDPPDHTRLRRPVLRAFTARRVELLRPATVATANELIDRMESIGPPVDLVEHFATPLPVRVICGLLGVPVGDQDLFRTWSEAFISSTSLSPEKIQEYIGNLYSYISGLIAQRRVTPSDDLLTAIVQAHDDREEITEQEMVELAAGLLAAGHETTVLQISNFMYVLMRHQAEREKMTGDPSLIPSAVEELLRFVPLFASSTFARYATEDVRVGGTLVRAGDPVVPSLTSANRDPSVFTDPDRLDVTRAANPHFGFGHGAHHCIGARLARMELQVSLETLLTRLPNLRLAADDDQELWKEGLILRGMKSMPVTW